MTKVVTITKQGQISIPASFRKKLGLTKQGKVLVYIENGRLVMEPTVDFLELGGILKSKALKGKKIQEIIELEERAIEEHYAEKYK